MAITAAGLLVAACGGNGQNVTAAPAGTAAAVTHHTQSAPPPAPAPLRAGERLDEYHLTSAYTPKPPNGGTDDYRCFTIDPHLTSPTYLTGTQFLPDNPDIVHHAIIFKANPGDASQVSQLDGASAGEGWTCFAGTGIGGVAGQLSQQNGWLGAWAPGGHENEDAPGYGMLLQPGTKLILQIHYNLLATGGKATEADQSGIRIRFATASTKLKQLNTSLLPAPVELPCPAADKGPLCDRETSELDSIKRFGVEAGSQVAGLDLLCNGGRKPVPGNTQHCDRTVRRTEVIHAVAGHMHLLGKSITVQVNPGTPKAKTLLNVANYNFDDQSAHILPQPVTVQPGDVLRVTCTHDATLRDKLPELRPLKPRYVLWGEGTSDEMCLGVMIWSAT